MRPQFAPASALLWSLHSKHGIYLTICRISCRNFSSSTRLSRLVSLADFRETNVQIPIGSAGNISLNVLQPITLPASQLANVILYLPPGPLFPNNQSDTATRFIDEAKKPAYSDRFPSPQHALSSTTLSTVVTVNYRLGEVEEDGEQKCYYYPGPVHDTLAGFDWIFEHLKPKRLCVFGKHIGGSLAVMLALTEPRSVTAIAAHEPMCDWTSLDDYCLKTDAVPDEDIGADGAHSNGSNHGEKTTLIEEQIAKKRRRKKKVPFSPPDLVPLLEARSSLFRNPDNFFDSFASPILFLRSAGKETPKFSPAYYTGPDYPIPVLKIPPKDMISGPDFTRYFQDLDLDLIPSPPLDLDSDSTDLEKPVRRRKALSRWPPYGLEYNDRPGAKSLGLWAGKPNLPHVRIFVHSDLTSELEPELAPELTPEAGVDTNIFATASQAGYEGRSALNSGADDVSRQVEESDEFHSDSRTEENTPKYIPSTPRPRRRRTSRKRTLEDDGETILARQGAEMVSLMRNACFWGREKGYAEERVKTVNIPLSSSSTVSPGLEGDGLEKPENSRKRAEGCMDELSSIEEQAGRYFYDILERENGKKW
ncbi:hypothetical protein EMCG_07417 [[Emmonsia] crescens]|uniref:Uncharacterized protein n=1 Tax=[Emmonsia] crescens TaxID=73230 RepID=A0A0G2JB61_9EURO|nr:hypothetical protein EMCG_07417 [Emmonsia crescens UAMH 3008]